jgi:hypothetical protein
VPEYKPPMQAPYMLLCTMTSRYYSLRSSQVGAMHTRALSLFCDERREGTCTCPTSHDKLISVIDPASAAIKSRAIHPLYLYSAMSNVSLPTLSCGRRASAPTSQESYLGRPTASEADLRRDYYSYSGLAMLLYYSTFWRRSRTYQSLCQYYKFKVLN